MTGPRGMWNRMFPRGLDPINDYSDVIVVGSCEILDREEPATTDAPR
jgi:hypothetical protein